MVDENMMTCDSPNMDLRWPARAAWYRSANCVEPRVQPGGWSTFGQPVDSLHAEFRSEIRRRDLSSTGHVANLRSRARYSTPLHYVFILQY